MFHIVDSSVRKVFHDLDFVTQGSLQQLIGRDHDSILTEKKIPSDFLYLSIYKVVYYGEFYLQD